jgi:hypothetical protein
MDRHQELLALMLLDPCLTTDEASREAAARLHTAEARATAERTTGTRRQAAELPETHGPAVGF